METKDWILLIAAILWVLVCCCGMNEDGPDRGDTGYEDISRSINGVAL
jgi:hypothetical protein